MDVLSNAITKVLAFGLGIVSSAPTSMPASAPTSAPTTAPVVTPDTLTILLKDHIGILSLGLLVLTIWLVRRIAYRQVLYLHDAPGRPNTLSPAIVVLALLVPITVGMVIREAMQKTMDQGLASLLATIAQILIWIIGITILAQHMFKSGARRGMGLCFRHWVYDTGRAVLAILAVLPVCIALGVLFEYILPHDFQKFHPMMDLVVKTPDMILRITAILTAVILVPIGEEMIFRGLMQSMLRRYFVNPWPAIIITSIIFALMHHVTPQYIPSLLLLSLVLGYNYERTGRLLSPILIHMMFNAMNIAMTLKWI